MSAAANSDLAFRALWLKPCNEKLDMRRGVSFRVQDQREFGMAKDAGSEKWVYGFGDGSAEGESSMKNLLGGKGANLAEMSNLGLPVPPGFTITTDVCTAYYDNDRKFPAGLDAQVDDAMAQIGKLVGKSFGDVKNPLLVSVRSGARASMPGMMDTVLESWPQRRDGAGACRPRGRPNASLMSPIAVSSRCMATL